VIGMTKAIGDRAAIEFAVGFYDGLGAGRSIEDAYELGRVAIQMAGIAEHLTPVLLRNPALRNPVAGSVNPTRTVPRSRNEQLLLQQVKVEVSDRLRQSLHNAVLINLGKEAQLEKVKRPWDAAIKIGARPAEPLPEGITVGQVFDRPEISSDEWERTGSR
jgi:hypothetical protein